MAYGIAVKRTATEELLSLDTVGGRVFRGIFEAAAGTTENFNLTDIPSEGDLLVYTLSAGGHNVTKSTITSGGSTYARLTLTARYTDTASIRFNPPTQVAVFANSTAEPTYGISLINSSGIRTASTIYPVPVFLQKITFGSTRTEATPDLNSASVTYYHSASVQGAGTQRLIFYTIPSNSNTSVYYWGDSYISSSVTTITVSVNSPNSTTVYTLPEAYVFSLSFVKSAETRGIRVFNASGNVTFDSGLRHIDVFGTTTATFNTTETALGTSIDTNKAILLPSYIREKSDGVFNGNTVVQQSNVNKYYGAYRRSNSTSIVAKEQLVETRLEDSHLTYNELYGSSSSNNIIIIDATRYAAIGTSPISIEIISLASVTPSCSYNAWEVSACETTEQLSASVFGGNNTAITYTWSLNTTATNNGFTIHSGQSTAVVTIKNSSNAGTKTGTLTCQVTQSGTTTTKTYDLSHTHTGLTTNLSGSISRTGGTITCSYTSGNCVNTATYQISVSGGSGQTLSYAWSLSNNTGGLSFSGGTSSSSVSVTKTATAGTYSATLNCQITQSGAPNSPITVSQTITFTHTDQSGNVVQPLPQMTDGNLNVTAAVFTGEKIVTGAGATANAYIRFYIETNGHIYLTTNDITTKTAAYTRWWWSAAQFDLANPPSNWSEGIPNIGNNYYVKFTRVSTTGNANNSSISTGWLSLSSARVVEVTATSNQGAVEHSAQYKIEISTTNTDAGIVSTTNGPKLVARAVQQDAEN